jgi:hypothetical protein
MPSRTLISDLWWNQSFGYKLPLLLLALSFSLLSATRFGWRNFNVGTWITGIKPHQLLLVSYRLGRGGFGDTVSHQRLLGRVGDPDVLRYALRTKEHRATATIGAPGSKSPSAVDFKLSALVTGRDD